MRLKILPRPNFGLRSYLTKLNNAPALYLSHAIKSFGQALVGIFIPIFIFTLPNKPIISENSVINGLLFVILFYLIRALIGLIIIPPSAVTIFQQLNFKKSIFASNIILALALLCLSATLFNFNFFYVAAALFSFENVLYWIPFHLFFIRMAGSSDGKFGKSFSLRLVSVSVASAFAPIIGGVVAMLLGFESLFILGTAIIIIAAVPILFSVHENKHATHNAIKAFIDRLFNKSYKYESAALASSEIEAIIATIFWPVLLFLVLENTTNVGAITSASQLIAAVSAVIIGRIVDKTDPRKIHKIGVLINSLNHIPRIVVSSPISIYAVDMLGKLNGGLFTIPFNAVMYSVARSDDNDSEFILYRTMLIHTAAIFATTLSIILIFVLPNWKLIFMIAAVFSMATYLINFRQSGQ